MSEIDYSGLAEVMHEDNEFDYVSDEGDYLLVTTDDPNRLFIYLAENAGFEAAVSRTDFNTYEVFSR
jgi:hypothetical protein